MLPNIGFPELMIILAFGVLLFGKRLPEVGRSLGKGIVEFKKGLRGIEEEVEEASNRPDRPTKVDRAEIDFDAPKFDKPPSEVQKV